MTSFYGNAATSSSGGGSGTSNYNELSNKPITNLVGLTSVNLATLNLGLYNIRGNYIYSSADTEVKSFNAPMLLQVLLDTVTGNKIVTYDLYENGKHLTYTITYSSETEYNVDRYTYEVVVPADTTEDLPEEGSASQLYATDDGLYVWNETASAYVKLGESSGGSDSWDEM